MIRQTIQIFGCDHHRNYEWKLPFIRIGNKESDAIVNTKDDLEISPFSLLLSEGAQIWYVWKHLTQFGNPEYIGFCHYRRFFGKATSPIYDFPESQLSQQHIFSPIEQYQMMKSNNIDGLVPHPLCPLSKDHGYSNIIEQTKMISDIDGLGFTTEVVNKSFEIFLANVPSDLKAHVEKALQNPEIFVCNIFTIRTDLFKIYGQIISTTFKQIAEFIKDKDTSQFHKRWMGYIMERFTSLLIYAFIYSGKQISICPLLTIDGWKHEKFEKHVGE